MEHSTKPKAALFVQTFNRTQSWVPAVCLRLQVQINTEFWNTSVSVQRVLGRKSNNSGNMVWKCWHSIPGSPWREQLQRPLLFERHHASPPWLKESVRLTASACLAQTTGPKMLDMEGRLRKSNIKDRIKVNIIRHTYPNNVFKITLWNFFSIRRPHPRWGVATAWFGLILLGLVHSRQQPVESSRQMLF